MGNNYERMCPQSTHLFVVSLNEHLIAFQSASPTCAISVGALTDSKGCSQYLAQTQSIYEQL